MKIFELLTHGGPLIWPLLGLSVLGLVFFLERAFYLHKGQIRTADFVEGIKNLVRKRRVLEALTVCEETPGPVAAVVKAALLHHQEDEGRLRGAIQAMALVEIPSLERRLGTIAAIAKVAPILGLLGTTVALRQAFVVMSGEGAYANASSFSGEMAAALITTVAGLTIAVVAYLGYHFLYGRVRALVHDMEWVGNDMLLFLLTDLPGTPPPADKDNGASTP